ncbi:FAD-dependent oxidoreductase [Microtetraspora sp. AC03309]|uniref:FAD-dependent oxidoreductase n=1 Tax=Microtetraspora sp. AC03309 TaxID=2779376 RepID=UPI00272EC919|nr:FAD-dependent oxidoreductase [Microtetraspora sp. AC03309]MCC5575471.1 FAD-dependent oxidoreductase [Microtetraspora sp. AC03309]
MTERTREIVAPQGEERRYEVVVVGGGAAGLSGALTLARARRSVLVIDAGRPRNAPAGHVHSYLGREGTPPADLLATGRAEVTGYGGEIVDGDVVAVERLDAGGFRVVLDGGTAVVADRLLVTTGLVDELPPVPGVAERWGREVLHCPYCHGWEVRGQAIGILATGPLAVHQALMWRQWSTDVTLFAHTAPRIGDDDYERLVARGIAVVDGEVKGLEVTDDRLTGVRLTGGRVVSCQALVVGPRFTARADILTGLGLETTEQEMGGHVVGTYVAADPSGATRVPGVWVAGNVANLTEQVIGAAAAGVRAAAAINADLTAEETSRAVAARRHDRHHHPVREDTGHADTGHADTGHADTGHEHTREHTPMTEDNAATEEFWDARYGQSDQIWSGNPNAVLVREVTGLEPGRALDLGCGEGADAIWLARRGWHVTAVDISRVALDRAAKWAAAEDVADRIDWQWHDLGKSFPSGVFELVSAHFLHSPVELPREEILRTAAAAVAPGGVLLVVGHAGFPSWEHNPHPELHFPTSDEVLDALDLPDGQWEVLLSEEYERVQTDLEGQPATRLDNVLKIRRLGA